MYSLICRSCRLRPSELGYVRQHASEREMDPEDYIRKYDPTYDGNQMFLCEMCDIYGYPGETEVEDEL